MCYLVELKDKGGADISRQVLINVKVNKQVNKCVMYMCVTFL